MERLYCLEVAPEEELGFLGDNVSYRDPVFYSSGRVLHNLLRQEERHHINPHYFKCVQSDIKTPMRKVVAHWMLEVCNAEQSRPEVYVHSMTILDRFLSVRRIKKTQLQLLGAVCMLLASKMRLTRPFTADKLSMYADFSISKEEIMEWEMLVLSVLKWDTASVIANDFLDHLLFRLHLDSQHDPQREVLRSHAQTFIALSSTEFEFCMYAPSTMAAASITCAAVGLLRLSRRQKADMLRSLHQMSNADEEMLRSCSDHIDQLIARTFPTAPPPSSPTSKTASGDFPPKVVPNPENGLQTPNLPETPTDVQDVPI